MGSSTQPTANPLLPATVRDIPCCLILVPPSSRYLLTCSMACLTTREAPRAGRTGAAARTTCGRAPERAALRAVRSLAPAAAEETGWENRAY